MRIRSVFAVVTLAVTLVAGSASIALAKPASWDSVDVVVHDDQGTQLMIVSGTLPAETPLPADVELSLPAGTQLQWAGEILGGDAASDPTVQYTVAKKGDSDVYSFKLTKGRTAQLEAVTPGAVTAQGANYAAALKWTPSQDTKTVLVGFRIPAGAQIAQQVPGAKVDPGPAGFSYYRTMVKDAKAGQPISFAFGYSVPAAPSTAPASSGGTAMYLTIAVLLAAVVGIGYAIYRKMSTKGSGSATPSRPAPANASAKAKAGGAKTASGKPASARTASATPAAGATGGSNSKAKWVVAGVIVALAAGAVFAVSSTSKPQVAADGVISRTFSSAEPCTSTVVPLAADATQDPQGAADKLFKSIETLPSLTTAKVFTDQPRIEVGFCESSLQAAQVRDALSTTGLVAD